MLTLLLMLLLLPLLMHCCCCRRRYRTTARIWDTQKREVLKVIDVGPQAKVRGFDTSVSRLHTGAHKHMHADTA